MRSATSPDENVVVASAEDGVGISEAAGLDPKFVAQNRWALARALEPIGRERAIALANAAAAELAGTAGHERTLREVQRWLAARRTLSRSAPGKAASR